MSLYLLSITLIACVLTQSFGIEQYQCEDNGNTNRNKWHMRGTSLGGWLVLEPWITPSLFYQFLGAYEKWGDDSPNHIGLDSYTFCTALGDVEANKQLRRHWATWVTEEDFIQLASSGIDTIRVPVGDWIFVPYGPYANCFAGALDEIDRILALAKKYKLNILFDIHAMKGSQNANDNSGKASVHWNNPNSYEKVLSASWMGTFDPITLTTEVNSSYMTHSLQVIDNILELYKGHDNVVGIEAVNEPWYYTPIDELKEFYWNVYQLVQSKAPHWISLFHDSFRLDIDTWGTFLMNCDNFAFDSHLYLAWQDPTPISTYLFYTCDRAFYLKQVEKAHIPVVIGEWSLATDNCALWLNGLNNNVYGYPKKKCEMIKCPDPYMGFDQPGAPPDSSKGMQDPFGTSGVSTPLYGMCPRDSEFEDDDKATKDLSFAQLEVYESTHGQFFWNFKTEFEPKWSFLEAVKKGWIPKTWNNEVLSSLNTCNGINKIGSSETIVKINHTSSVFIYTLISLLTISIILLLLKYYYQNKIYKYKSIQSIDHSTVTNNEIFQIMKSYQNIDSHESGIELSI